jgi:DNA-binding transcriptional MerR regulator
MQNEIKQKQFCRLTGLTRKALLVYEEKGVLNPCRIDPSTGYRYYGENEVRRGVKIAFLRSLSFSVNELKSLVDDEPGGAEILLRKEEVLAQELHRIRNGLQFIELNRNYPFPFSEDIRETTLPLYQVATIEGRGTSRDVSVHHKLLARQLLQEGVEQRMYSKMKTSANFTSKI